MFICWQKCQWRMTSPNLLFTSWKNWSLKLYSRLSLTFWQMQLFFFQWKSPKKCLINDVISVLWAACLFPYDAAEVLSILSKTLVFCSFLQHNLKLKKAANICRYLYWSLVCACCIVGFSPNVWICIWMNFYRR